MKTWHERRTGQRKGLRRGDVFPIRIHPEQKETFERAQALTAGPRALGPWILWAAQCAVDAKFLPARGLETVIPSAAAPVIPSDDVSSGNTELGPPGRVIQTSQTRRILDLCAGSGAWSEPYERAGYEVIRVTLPSDDVKTYQPPPDVWGVLAAPPCDQFSVARNGHDTPRDFFGALEIVLGCLRVIALSRPQWWALENPTGLLGRWLGTPRDVWQPHEFGDAWTKRTAIWGRFNIPRRGPYVEPIGSAMDRPTSAERAITPPGFAQAFYKANP